MATKYSGFDGSVTIGGVDFCMRTYSITDSSDETDVSDSCSGGFKDVIPTQREGTFSLTAWYDGDNPPVYTSGQRDVEFIFMVKDDYIAHFPKSLITSVSASVDVSGGVEYTIEGKNMGQYAMWGYISPSA